ncbi:MAG: M3 family metallopeptidase [Legionellaceae bacterium]|nr:M3 family metallopeptidase [Legionellaceae bacterium]
MATHLLPTFSNIDMDTYVSRLDAILASHLQHITDILNNTTVFTWDNLMRPLDDMDDELERFWSPMSHVHAVVNSPALRTCYQACLPKLSAYESAIGQNQALYDAVNALDKSMLDSVQCKIVDDALRNFRLSGVALSLEHKRRFEAISTRLSALSNQFENNILDAVQDFHAHITESVRLAGLPEHTLASAKALAEEKNLSGWVLNLEHPCFVAVVTYADDRALRETFYQAYSTRASDQGPSAGKFDNTQNMDEILALRFESARLLNFANYAELSLATKMAESTQQVDDFLTGLVSRARAQAGVEFQELEAFAREEYQISDIMPWDVAYLSEKKQHALFEISQEMLRPYFPLDQVMSGLFTIVNKLYGMTLELVKDVDTWHPDVTCYCILDETKNVRGYVYVDLFARPHKRGGAWMDSCQSRFKRLDGSIQLPIATLTCNFAKATAKKPPVLSHDEVLTLFHEFGHCLHHVLTQVDYISASGVHGVEWDAVELPSQFFENWCWEEHALALLTKHVDTDESLPATLFQQLIAAKNFQSAMGMMRQLEFSIFDFRIHQEYVGPDPTFIPNVLADVRKKTTVVPIAPYNRFQHSFSHIFAGGYAAGYYSYKWAEVLSSDAFARFEEEGVFNEQTGRDFLHNILEVGGSRKALPAFVSFRGRMATVDALLRHTGIME